MLASRVAFVDSTNSWNSRSFHHSRPVFPPKLPLSSRKSAPTCTVSLASAGSSSSSNPSASADDLRISISIDVSPSATSAIPFPSSTSDVPLISQPDPTCLLRSQPLPTPSACRKRLCQPIYVPQSAAASNSPQASDQPPRKRPRLLKSAKIKKSLQANAGTGKRKVKGASCPSTPELRFMAVLQRSVARGVLERKVRVGSDSRLQWNMALEAEDRHLACRLRTYLLEQGFRNCDVIDVDLGHGNDGMDVDIEMEVDVGDSPEPLAAVSVDMDIDVEPQEKRFLSSKPSESKSTRCAPYRSPSPPPPSASPPTLSPSQLVASLIMRHRSRIAVRPNGPSSEHSDGVSTKTRMVSPLARFEPISES